MEQNAHETGRQKEKEKDKNDHARITHRRAVIAAGGNRATYTRLHRYNAIDISVPIQHVLHANITGRRCESRTFIFICICTQNPMFDPQVQILLRD